MFFLGFLKILPFHQYSLFLLLIGFVIINFFILRLINKNQEKKDGEQINPIILIITEEFLFVVSFIFWVFVRGQEPSIRGLEKFMDFGFINSILRAKHFPPLDMWLSGHSINYYYFGHLTG
ncbi:MAG: DUF2298 domain-containing protein, partial [Patescibacteria group bacterium]|nr:DUF2298 domain-containing protein [Patescibacteria group bacterium]